MLTSRPRHGFVPLRPYGFWIGIKNNTISHEFFSHLMDYDLFMIDASSPISGFKEFKLAYLWPKYNAQGNRLATDWNVKRMTSYLTRKWIWMCPRGLLFSNSYSQISLYQTVPIWVIDLPILLSYNDG